MVSKVLVVGGAGYIGGAVTNALTERGIPFTVYDNLTYEHHYLKPVEFIYGDVRDHEKLARLLPEASHVIWLAALVGDGACAIKADLAYDINLASVVWLAQHFEGRILFTSTCSVYGASDSAVSEESAVNPLSVYAHTKLGAERCLAQKNAFVIRIGTAFGIPDHFSRIRMDLAINYMTMNAVLHGKLTIFGGQQWRPFIHVKDIAKTLVACLDRPETGVYNLATTNMQIGQLAQLIQRATHCEVETTDVPIKDLRNYNADVGRAKIAGILPGSSFDVAAGIAEIAELVASRRVRDFGHELYSNEKSMRNQIGEYQNGFTQH